MNELEKLANNLRSINIPEIITDILREQKTLSEIERIVSLRLYNDGTDADGNKFRTDSAKRQGNAAYAGFTYQEKKRKGQKATNVTFRDTGQFHSSIKAKTPNKSVIISADFKDIYDNFRTSYSGEKQFEDAVIGVTESQLEYIRLQLVLPRLESHIKKLLNVV